MLDLGSFLPAQIELVFHGTLRDIGEAEDGNKPLPGKYTIKRLSQTKKKSISCYSSSHWENTPDHNAVSDIEIELELQYFKPMPKGLRAQVRKMPTS